MTTTFFHQQRRCCSPCRSTLSVLLYLLVAAIVATAVTAASESLPVSSTSALEDDNRRYSIGRNAVGEEIVLPGHTVFEKYELPLPYTYVEAGHLPRSFSWGDVGGLSYLTRSLNQVSTKK